MSVSPSRPCPASSGSPWTRPSLTRIRSVDWASMPSRLLSRPSLATQYFYGARPVQHIVPPSRCVRCGAVSRDYLCASCIDYLIAYHPLWLNPALLPGPSLLDLVAPRESPLVSSDL